MALENNQVEPYYTGLSMRKITKKANVSQELVNHHFGSMKSRLTIENIEGKYVR